MYFKILELKMGKITYMLVGTLLQAEKEWKAMEEGVYKLLKGQKLEAIGKPQNKTAAGMFPGTLAKGSHLVSQPLKPDHDPYTTISLL